jgi:hypothetical protein
MCDHIWLPHLIVDGGSFEPVSHCEILFGHLFYGVIHGYNAARQPLYATVLRDPLERVLSLYYYVLRYPDHYQVDLKVTSMFLPYFEIISKILTFTARKLFQSIVT